MAFDDLPPQTPINPRADSYAALALALSRATAERGRCVLDVPYGPDYWQRLDLYLPTETGRSGLPVFLCIHGGGWTHGYKEWMGFQAPVLVSLPAIYVSVSYRLAPAHPFPAALDDCLEALAWVHRNIRRHGGDPDRLFLGGHSAGAHLSALTTLRRDRHAAHGLPPDPIKACFPFSGVYSFDHDGAGESGKAFLAGVADTAAAAPLAHVAGNRVPFFVTWAKNERPTIIGSSERFVAALQAQPGRVAQHLFPEFDHFYIHLDMMRPDNLWVRTVRAWMAGDPARAPVG